MDYNSNLFTLKDICKKLSISITTGKNWLKLNKLTPSKTINGTPFFSEEYVMQLEQYIKSNSNHTLKSRRNKKHISGNGIYKSYINSQSTNNESVQSILDIISNHSIELCDKYISAIIAECALRLFCQKLNINCSKKTSYLLQFLRKELIISPYDCLINDFIQSPNKIVDFIHSYPELFSIDYLYEDSEDILGLLYISINNIGTRKATGAYYTPTTVVQQLISHLSVSTNQFQNMNILDPCCGTGNFLLQLPPSVNWENIYGNDIDTTSVTITRINMALRFQPTDIESLYSHIAENDYLNFTPSIEFHCILGNPPWGYDFSDDKKHYLKEHYTCATGKNIEAYDVFIEQALLHLNENGFLSFVLPEAILNVKSHAAIRKQILSVSSINNLSYLGNVFNQVQCPCIIMELCKTNHPLSTNGMHIYTKDADFIINTTRTVTPDLFNFTATDNEYDILNKILHSNDKVTLQNNADFALGIVTGNNKEYISNNRTEDSEIILRGTNIFKYRILDTNDYITFSPENYQQIAPIEFYRAPEKLLYRFICNQLVFAYDNNQTLSLNSCNIVIPHIDNLQIKYILAILNSRIAQFIFNKQFHSVKILRSHIEQIPLPLVDASIQETMIHHVDALISETETETITELYNSLDKEIANLFHLTEREYNTILSSLENQNLFLNE